VLAGQSLGGLVTSHIAHAIPNRFGWVIGLSVAAWWKGDDDGGLTGQQILDAIAGSPRVPVRFLLDVGSQERELLDSVRLMRDTLRSHGYDVRYREYEGGHDLAC
jgi:enterochelin esterase family protein